MYNLDSDNELLNIDELWLEADSWESFLIETTNDSTISIGISVTGPNEYEVWLDRGSESTKHFNSFDKLHDYMRENYTDVEWN